MTNKIKHIIWDWNGTLFDDTRLTFEIWKEELHLHQLPDLSFENYRSADKRDLYQWFLSLGFSSEEQLHACMKSWYKKYILREKTCDLHAAAPQVLAQLAQAQCKQSILSAHPQPELDAILRHFQIHHYFDQVSGRDPLLNDFSKIIRGKNLILSAKVAPHETLVIGDSPHDAEVAKELGAHCLLVDFGISDNAQLKAWAKTLSHLKELFEHFQVADPQPSLSQL